MLIFTFVMFAYYLLLKDFFFSVSKMVHRLQIPTQIEGDLNLSILKKDLAIQTMDSVTVCFSGK